MEKIKAGRLAISIDTESLGLFILFCTSLLNSTMLLVSTVFVILFLIVKNKIAVGGTKALVFIAIRTIISSGLAPGYDTMGTIKWALILLLAGLMIIVSISKEKNINSVSIRLLFAFFGFLLIDSFFFSGYPIVSMFKAFSWMFVFYAVIIAVACNSEIDWVGYIVKYLNTIVIASPIAIVLGIAYLRNGHAFQGVINHPNMFGVITALTFGLNIHLLQRKTSLFKVLMLGLSLGLCFLSESRTGVLCIALSFVVYVWFSSISKWKKITLTIITVLSGIVLLSMGYGESLLGFIYKGRAVGDLLYSREGQISRAISKFENNRWFGSGFMVPYNSGMQSFNFSFELTVEPGNIIIALLGDIGIIGIVLFSILYGQMFFRMDKRNILLFMIPLVASMGEMMFFSTNNIASIYYILYAVCISSQRKRKDKR